MAECQDWAHRRKSAQSPLPPALGNRPMRDRWTKHGGRTPPNRPGHARHCRPGSGRCGQLRSQASSESNDFFLRCVPIAPCGRAGSSQSPSRRRPKPDSQSRTDSWFLSPIRMAIEKILHMRSRRSRRLSQHFHAIRPRHFLRQIANLLSVHNGAIGSENVFRHAGMVAAKARIPGEENFRVRPVSAIETFIVSGTSRPSLQRRSRQS